MSEINIKVVAFTFTMIAALILLTSEQYDRFTEKVKTWMRRGHED